MYQKTDWKVRSVLNHQVNTRRIGKFFQWIDGRFQFSHWEEREEDTTEAIGQDDGHETPDADHDRSRSR